MCQLCHQRAGGGNGWNRYGWSIRTALNTQSAPRSVLIAALDDVENVSDGNGSTYFLQINSNAQPGWFVGDNNRIRSVGLGSNGQLVTLEEFTSANGVRPCGVFLDPPLSQQEQEIRRVQSCSTTDPITSSILKEGPRVALESIATGFTAPVTAVTAPGQTGVIYVVEQTGGVWRVNLDTGEKRQFLDFSQELVSNLGQLSGGFDERGLLGFAFHPDFAVNNKVYTYLSVDFNQAEVDFSTLEDGQTADHMTEISEWVVANPLTEQSVATNKRELMAVAQPQFNHNAGMLAFGPSGNLFISLGDGGNRNDEGVGHGQQGNSRDNTNVLGSILRIDVDQSAPANGRYGIPADNPFVGQAGEDEIYVYGLRNPYRFSIESRGNDFDLYIGDVGQDAIEELNRIPLSQSGSNFGWNYKEGSFFFSVIGGTTFVSEVPPIGETIPPLVDPLVEYDHNEGLSVIAGHVYLAQSIPELTNRYIFGDWGTSFSNPDGRLFFVNAQDQLRELDLVSQPNIHVTGFGRDLEGEVYVLGSPGFRVSDQNQGSLLKLVPAEPSIEEDLCVPIKAKTGSIILVCL